jgi:hypothetical protein
MVRVVACAVTFVQSCGIDDSLWCFVYDDVVRGQIESILTECFLVFFVSSFPQEVAGRRPGRRGEGEKETGEEPATQILGGERDGRRPGRGQGRASDTNTWRRKGGKKPAGGRGEGEERR